MVCGILVPQPVIKFMLPELEEQSLNRWTTRKVFTWFFKSSSQGNVKTLEHF